ncbi:aldehyde dehydrogenase family protein [Saccharibacillus sp. CPCC 101409]|uniref:aldehyde dehydrogenase family protein n=1 Tax=Saccharibacillus sp. CPCC 101409 TaxID=3058041 RepID=UPI002674054F|nr:aldehyde dehydrogenase family protein [Saccharibacillus sp. CPCC 101409]MDO3411385.1 aldehyde dehydrogenase family protein [Saccharibacillus sp. CPCC 101409]
MNTIDRTKNRTSKPRTDWTRQYIGGEWIEGTGEKTLENINPYNGETIASFKSAGKDDIDRAYKASLEAGREWAALPPGKREEVLRTAVAIIDERKDEIVDLLVRESGSTMIKAQLEWKSARRVTDEAASFPYRMKGDILPSDTPGKENRVVREAKGVIGMIGPWNFPLHLCLRTVAPALALGNGVVIKPASDTPITAGFLIADIFEQAGLPAGVLNVIAGSGSEIGDDFVTHPIPKLISFTGSTEVGRGIGEKAGRELKEVALELGGNNVMVVLDDADVDRAVEAAVFGKFLHQGQICMALNRIVIDASVYDEFTRKFVEKVKGLKYGDPSDPETLVGPLIHAKEVERLQKEIDAAVKGGAKLAAGGGANGSVLEPSVLIDVDPKQEIVQKELFGPVALLIQAKDEEDAIAIANDTEYGLSGSVFSGNIERGYRAAKRIETGMVHVNDQSVNDEAHVMFGGEKASGLGRFGGEWAIEKFTRSRWISIQQPYRDFPI